MLRYARGRSRRHAYTVVLGMIVGSFIWGVAAATGVSARLAVSAIAFDMVRVIGAECMLWLAFSFWRASFHTDDVPVDATGGNLMPTAEHLGKTWAKGFLSNILYPRYGMFCWR